MRQYLDFMRHVYEHGTPKTDRTGTGKRLCKVVVKNIQNSAEFNFSGKRREKKKLCAESTYVNVVRVLVRVPVPVCTTSSNCWQ